VVQSRALQSADDRATKKQHNPDGKVSSQEASVGSTTMEFGCCRRRCAMWLMALLCSADEAGAQIVSVYNQAGLTGSGIGSCDDEASNLQSIVQHLINNSPMTIAGTSHDFSSFSVDASITSFGNPDLASKLTASAFFFMTDMESTVTGLTSATRSTLASWVNGGGVMLMTGTLGSTDATFLNDVFGWDTSSVTCATQSLNGAAASGTPFANAASSVGCPSATDNLNCGTKACSPIYGTSSKAAVALFTHGSGSVVYVGFGMLSTRTLKPTTCTCHKERPLLTVGPYA
jgi:hypothetical protein